MSASEQGESSDGPLIPGPAGIIQKAIRRKKNKHHSAIDAEGEAISTQQIIKKIEAEKGRGDADFDKEPWVTAITFVREEARLMQIPANCQFMTAISSLFDGTTNWGRIEKVVGMVQTFEPNGRGDAMVTIKDPSGTIDASVHRKVFEDPLIAGNIRVGSVIILKKVAVIRMSRTKCYLNIVAKNIDKVFTNENYLQPEQVDHMEEDGYVSDSEED